MSARPSRRTTAAAPRSATPVKAVASAAAPAQAMALYEQVKDHIALVRSDFIPDLYEQGSLACPFAANNEICLTPTCPVVLIRTQKIGT